MKAHIQPTLDALQENWFLGSELGPKYARVLKRYVDERTDQLGLDAALALGSYPVHTEANKQQRKALRAVLLAEFVMREQPLDIKDKLVGRYKDLSTDQLKQQFCHTFPPFLDDGNRAAWAPNNFTQPSTLVPLYNPADWTNKAVPPYRFITHSIRANSALLKGDPMRQLMEFTAISCAVLSSDKPVAFSNCGLILYVPENNIITTSPTDQWFDNYAGTAKSSKAEGQSMAQHIGEKTIRIGGLLTPDNVLAKQNTPQAMDHYAGAVQSKYNEVIVTGQPNQPMPYGRTDYLHLLGFFLQTNMDGTFPEKYIKSQGDSNIVRLCVTEAAQRLNVRVLYLPTDQIQ
jgi:hypothetical protein